MKVLRALGVALALTGVSLACSDPPGTTSAPSPTAASPFAVSYTVMASAGANGAISPAGAVSVPAAGIQGFTITPAANYRIADVVVDGNSVGPVPTVTLNDVKASHTVTATFVPDPLVGLFTGPIALTSAQNTLDRDCIAPSIATRIGIVEESALSVTLSQTSVAATLRSASSGLQCSYTGQAAGGFFSANAPRCDAPAINVQCVSAPTDPPGQPRVLHVIGSTITGQLSGNTVVGTVATYYNVDGSAGGLITQHSFTATRR